MYASYIELMASLHMPIWLPYYIVHFVIYLILELMFFYIILYHIYMYNIDPITFLLNFLYIKGADQSTSMLIL